MAITVLNNVSDLKAEQALSNTQAALQKTLTQLSTGLRINNGSDDAAGLAIANGITSNVFALTQSQQNAANGVGLLQTTDGALSQVTGLLDRAITIATEGSTGGISSTQYTALNTEFLAIKAEIDQIETATNFNGQNVFSNAAPQTFTSTQASLTSASTIAANETVTITDASTGGTFVYKAPASATLAGLTTAITNAVTAGTLSSTVTGTIVSGHFVIAETSGNGLTVSTTATETGPFVGNVTAGSGTVYVGDGTTPAGAGTNIVTTISALSSTLLNLNVSGVDLLTAADSQQSLTAINAAITTISSQRGSIGASVNRINAASNVIGDQITNLQTAVNALQNADIGVTVANLTQYNILTSTGIAALQQANQAQQAVLKLVQ